MSLVYVSNGITAAGAYFKSSDSKIYAGTSTANLGATGVAVTTGQWYRVDVKVDSSANPWLIDVQVDGVACGQRSTATAGANCPNFIVGETINNFTGDLFFDDILASNTLADYPLGDGYVNHFVPVSDGTHNVAGAADFSHGTAGADITNATTDAWTLIDDVPLPTGSPSTTDLINLLAPPNATDYVECVFGPASGISTPTVAPRFVEVIAAIHQAGTGAGNMEIRLNDNGTTGVIYTATGVAGVTSFAYKRAGFSDPPSAASAWTLSGNGNFNNVRVRFGSPAAVDANPDQYLDAIMIEAEFANANVTSTQTTTGKARIQTTVNQTTTGKARVTATTTKTTTGLSRIQKLVSATTTGVSRIQKAVNATIAGLANILAYTSRTQAGKARIQTVANQTINGVASIAVMVSRTINGVSRITATAAQTIGGKARITATASQTTTGKARVQTTVNQTTTGLARVQKTVGQTTTGIARVTAAASQTTTGKSRIQTVVNATQAGLARIQTIVNATILGVARIASGVGVDQDITGKARITATTTRTSTGKARVQATASATITGKSRVSAASLRTTTGLARVQKTAAQTTTGLARITAAALQMIFGKARVTAAANRTINGLARMQAFSEQTITGVANILVGQTRTETITGLARIAVTVGQNISGRARIVHPLGLCTASDNAVAFAAVNDVTGIAIRDTLGSGRIALTTTNPIRTTDAAGALITIGDRRDI